MILKMKDEWNSSFLENGDPLIDYVLSTIIQ